MTAKSKHSLRLAGAALALAGSLVAGAALADDPAPTGQPARGEHMPAVEQHFGAPVTRYPAVGQPAITRWDYPNMVVYFENDLVLHTVTVSPSG